MLFLLYNCNKQLLLYDLSKHELLVQKQIKSIKRLYKKQIKSIKTRQYELENYQVGTGNESLDGNYLFQDIEIDAIAFAHKLMLEHFEVKTIIPDSIKEKVKAKLMF